MGVIFSQAIAAALYFIRPQRRAISQIREDSDNQIDTSSAGNGDVALSPETLLPLVDAESLTDLREAVTQTITKCLGNVDLVKVYLKDPLGNQLVDDQCSVLPTTGFINDVLNQKGKTAVTINSSHESLRDVLANERSSNDNSNSVFLMPIPERGTHQSIGLIVIESKSRTLSSGDAKKLELCVKQVSVTYEAIKSHMTFENCSAPANRLISLIQLCSDLNDQDAVNLERKVVRYAIGTTALQQEIRFAGPSSAFSHALETKQPMTWADIPEDQRHEVEKVVGSPINNLLCVPVTVADSKELLALACMANKQNQEEFNDGDTEIIRQCFKYTATVLTSTLAFQNERKLKNQTQALLQVAKKLFTRLGKFLFDFPQNLTSPTLTCHISHCYNSHYSERLDPNSYCVTRSDVDSSQTKELAHEIGSRENMLSVLPSLRQKPTQEGQHQDHHGHAVNERIDCTEFKTERITGKRSSIVSVFNKDCSCEFMEVARKLKFVFDHLKELDSVLEELPSINLSNSVETINTVQSQGVSLESDFHTLTRNNPYEKLELKENFFKCEGDSVNAVPCHEMPLTIASSQQTNFEATDIRGLNEFINDHENVTTAVHITNCDDDQDSDYLTMCSHGNTDFTSCDSSVKCDIVQCNIFCEKTAIDGGLIIDENLGCVDKESKNNFEHFNHKEMLPKPSHDNELESRECEVCEKAPYHPLGMTRCSTDEHVAANQLALSDNCKGDSEIQIVEKDGGTAFQDKPISYAESMTCMDLYEYITKDDTIHHDANLCSVQRDSDERLVDNIVHWDNSDCFAEDNIVNGHDDECIAEDGIDQRDNKPDDIFHKSNDECIAEGSIDQRDNKTDDIVHKSNDECIAKDGIDQRDNKPDDSKSIDKWISEDDIICTSCNDNFVSEDIEDYIVEDEIVCRYNNEDIVENKVTDKWIAGDNNDIVSKDGAEWIAKDDIAPMDNDEGTFEDGIIHKDTEEDSADDSIVYVDNNEQITEEDIYHKDINEWVAEEDIVGIVLGDIDEYNPWDDSIQRDDDEYIPSNDIIQRDDDEYIPLDDVIHGDNDVNIPLDDIIHGDNDEYIVHDDNFQGANYECITEYGSFISGNDEFVPKGDIIHSRPEKCLTEDNTMHEETDVVEYDSSHRGNDERIVEDNSIDKDNISQWDTDEYIPWDNIIRRDNDECIVHGDNFQRGNYECITEYANFHGDNDECIPKHDIIHRHPEKCVSEDSIIHDEIDLAEYNSGNDEYMLEDNSIDGDSDEWFTLDDIIHEDINEHLEDDSFRTANDEVVVDDNIHEDTDKCIAEDKLIHMSNDEYIAPDDNIHDGHGEYIHEVNLMRDNKNDMIQKDKNKFTFTYEVISQDTDDDIETDKRICENKGKSAANNYMMPEDNNECIITTELMEKDKRECIVRDDMINEEIDQYIMKDVMVDEERDQSIVTADMFSEEIDQCIVKDDMVNENRESLCLVKDMFSQEIDQCIMRDNMMIEMRDQCFVKDNMLSEEINQSVFKDDIVIEEVDQCTVEDDMVKEENDQCIVKEYSVNENKDKCIAKDDIVTENRDECIAKDDIAHEDTAECIVKHNLISDDTVECIVKNDMVIKNLEECLTKDDIVNEDAVEYIVKDDIVKKDTVECIAKGDIVNDDTFECIAEDDIINEVTVECIAKKDNFCDDSVECITKDDIVSEVTDGCIVKDDIVIEERDESIAKDDIVIEDTDVCIIKDDIIIEDTDECLAKNVIVNEDTVECVVKDDTVKAGTVECIIKDDIDECFVKDDIDLVNEDTDECFVQDHIINEDTKKCIAKDGIVIEKIKTCSAIDDIVNDYIDECIVKNDIVSEDVDGCIVKDDIVNEDTDECFVQDYIVNEDTEKCIAIDDIIIEEINMCTATDDIVNEVAGHCITKDNIGQDDMYVCLDMDDRVNENTVKCFEKDYIISGDTDECFAKGDMVNEQIDEYVAKYDIVSGGIDDFVLKDDIVKEEIVECTVKVVMVNEEKYECFSINGIVSEEIDECIDEDSLVNEEKNETSDKDDIVNQEVDEFIINDDTVEYTISDDTVSGDADRCVVKGDLVNENTGECILKNGIITKDTDKCFVNVNCGKVNEEIHENISMDSRFIKDTDEFLANDDIIKEDTVECIDRYDMSTKDRYECIAKDDIVKVNIDECIEKHGILRYGTDEVIDNDTVNEDTYECIEKVIKDKCIEMNDIPTQDTGKCIANDDTVKEEISEHIVMDEMVKVEKDDYIDMDDMLNEHTEESILKGDIIREEKDKCVMKADIVNEHIDECIAKQDVVIEDIHETIVECNIVNEDIDVYIVHDSIVHEERDGCIVQDGFVNEETDGCIVQDGFVNEETDGCIVQDGFVNEEIVECIVQDGMVTEAISDCILPDGIITEKIDESIVQDGIVNDDTVGCIAKYNIVNEDTVECFVKNDIVNVDTVEYIVKDDIVIDDTIKCITMDDIVNEDTFECMVMDDIVNDKIVQCIIKDDTVNEDTYEYIAKDDIVNENTVECIAKDDIVNEYTVECIAKDDIVNEYTVECIAKDDIVNENTVECIAKDDIGNEYTVECIAKHDIVNEYTVECIAKDNIVSENTVECIAKDDIVNENIVECIAKDDIVNEDTVECIAKDDIFSENTVECIVKDDIVNENTVECIVKDYIVNENTFECIVNDDIVNENTVECIVKDYIVNENTDECFVDDIVNENTVECIVKDDIINENTVECIAKDDLVNEDTVECIAKHDLVNEDTVECIAKDDLVNEDTVECFAKNDMVNEEINEYIGKDDIIHEDFNNDVMIKEDEDEFSTQDYMVNVDRVKCIAKDVINSEDANECGFVAKDVIVHEEKDEFNCHDANFPEDTKEDIDKCIFKEEIDNEDSNECVLPDGIVSEVRDECFAKDIIINEDTDEGNAKHDMVDDNMDGYMARDIIDEGIDECIAQGHMISVDMDGHFVNEDIINVNTDEYIAEDTSVHDNKDECIAIDGKINEEANEYIAKGDIEAMGKCNAKYDVMNVDISKCIAKDEMGSMKMEKCVASDDYIHDDSNECFVKGDMIEDTKECMANNVNVQDDSNECVVKDGMIDMDTNECMSKSDMLSQNNKCSVKYDRVYDAMTHRASIIQDDKISDKMITTELNTIALIIEDTEANTVNKYISVETSAHFIQDGCIAEDISANVIGELITTVAGISVTQDDLVIGGEGAKVIKEEVTPRETDVTINEGDTGEDVIGKDLILRETCAVVQNIPRKYEDSCKNVFELHKIDKKEDHNHRTDYCYIKNYDITDHNDFDSKKQGDNVFNNIDQNARSKFDHQDAEDRHDLDSGVKLEHNDPNADNSDNIDYNIDNPDNLDCRLVNLGNIVHNMVTFDIIDPIVDSVDNIDISVNNVANIDYNVFNPINASGNVDSLANTNNMDNPINVDGNVDSLTNTNNMDNPINVDSNVDSLANTNNIDNPINVDGNVDSLANTNNMDNPINASGNVDSLANTNNMDNPINVDSNMDILANTNNMDNPINVDSNVDSLANTNNMDNPINVDSNVDSLANTNNMDNPINVDSNVDSLANTNNMDNPINVDGNVDSLDNTDHNVDNPIKVDGNVSDSLANVYLNVDSLHDHDCNVDSFHDVDCSVDGLTFFGHNVDITDSDQNVDNRDIFDHNVDSHDYIDHFVDKFDNINLRVNNLGSIDPGVDNLDNIGHNVDNLVSIIPVVDNLVSIIPVVDSLDSIEDNEDTFDNTNHNVDNFDKINQIEYDVNHDQSPNRVNQKDNTNNIHLQDHDKDQSVKDSFKAKAVPVIKLENDEQKNNLNTSDTSEDVPFQITYTPISDESTFDRYVDNQDLISQPNQVLKCHDSSYMTLKFEDDCFMKHETFDIKDNENRLGLQDMEERGDNVVNHENNNCKETFNKPDINYGRIQITESFQSSGDDSNITETHHISDQSELDMPCCDSTDKNDEENGGREDFAELNQECEDTAVNHDRDFYMNDRPGQHIDNLDFVEAAIAFNTNFELNNTYVCINDHSKILCCKSFDHDFDDQKGFVMDERLQTDSFLVKSTSFCSGEEKRLEKTEETGSSNPSNCSSSTPPGTLYGESDLLSGEDEALEADVSSMDCTEEFPRIKTRQPIKYSFLAMNRSKSLQKGDGQCETTALKFIAIDPNEGLEPPDEEILASNPSQNNQTENDITQKRLSYNPYDYEDNVPGLFLEDTLIHNEFNAQNATWEVSNLKTSTPRKDGKSTSFVQGQELPATSELLYFDNIEWDTSGKTSVVDVERDDNKLNLQDSTILLNDNDNHHGPNEKDRTFFVNDAYYTVKQDYSVLMKDTHSSVTKSEDRYFPSINVNRDWDRQENVSVVNTSERYPSIMRPTCQGGESAKPDPIPKFEDETLYKELKESFISEERLCEAVSMSTDTRQADSEINDKEGSQSVMLDSMYYTDSTSDDRNEKCKDKEPCFTSSEMCESYYTPNSLPVLLGARRKLQYFEFSPNSSSSEAAEFFTPLSFGNGEKTQNVMPMSESFANECEFGCQDCNKTAKVEFHDPPLTSPILSDQDQSPKSFALDFSGTMLSSSFSFNESVSNNQEDSHETSQKNFSYPYQADIFPCVQYTSTPSRQEAQASDTPITSMSKKSVTFRMPLVDQLTLFTKHDDVDSKDIMHTELTSSSYPFDEYEDHEKMYISSQSQMPLSCETIDTIKCSIIPKSEEKHETPTFLNVISKSEKQFQKSFSDVWDTTSEYHASEIDQKGLVPIEINYNPFVGVRSSRLQGGYFSDKLPVISEESDDTEDLSGGSEKLELIVHESKVSDLFIQEIENPVACKQGSDILKTFAQEKVENKLDVPDLMTPEVDTIEDVHTVLPVDKGFEHGTPGHEGHRTAIQDIENIEFDIQVASSFKQRPEENKSFQTTKHRNPQELSETTNHEITVLETVEDITQGICTCVEDLNLEVNVSIHLDCTHDDVCFVSNDQTCQEEHLKVSSIFQMDTISHEQHKGGVLLKPGSAKVSDAEALVKGEPVHQFEKNLQIHKLSILKSMCTSQNDSKEVEDERTPMEFILKGLNNFESPFQCDSENHLRLKDNEEPITGMQSVAVENLTETTDHSVQSKEETSTSVENPLTEFCANYYVLNFMDEEDNQNGVEIERGECSENVDNGMHHQDNGLQNMPCNKKIKGSHGQAHDMFQTLCPKQQSDITMKDKITQEHFCEKKFNHEKVWGKGTSFTSTENVQSQRKQLLQDWLLNTAHFEPDYLQSESLDICKEETVFPALSQTFSMHHNETLTNSSVVQNVVHHSDCASNFKRMLDDSSFKKQGILNETFTLEHRSASETFGILEEQESINSNCLVKREDRQTYSVSPEDDLDAFSEEYAYSMNEVLNECHTTDSSSSKSDSDILNHTSSRICTLAELRKLQETCYSFALSDDCLDTSFACEWESQDKLRAKYFQPQPDLIWNDPHRAYLGNKKTGDDTDELRGEEYENDSYSCTHNKCVKYFGKCEIHDLEKCEGEHYCETFQTGFCNRFCEPEEEENRNKKQFNVRRKKHDLQYDVSIELQNDSDVLLNENNTNLSQEISYNSVRPRESCKNDWKVNDNSVCLIPTVKQTSFFPPFAHDSNVQNPICHLALDTSDSDIQDCPSLLSDQNDNLNHLNEGLLASMSSDDTDGYSDVLENSVVDDVSSQIQKVAEKCTTQVDARDIKLEKNCTDTLSFQPPLLGVSNFYNFRHRQPVSFSDIIGTVPGCIAHDSFDDLTKLLREIMQEARNLTDAERCSVFLLDEDSDELVAMVFDGITADDKERLLNYLRTRQGANERVQGEIRLPKTQGIAGHVATTGKLLNIRDAYSHPLFYRGIDDSTGFRTRNILCFPIKDEGGVVLGVAQLCNKKTFQYFTTFDEDIASAFAVYCCISISHSLMYKKVIDIQYRNSLANELMMFHMQSLMYKKLQDTQHRHRLANELMLFHIHQQVPAEEVRIMAETHVPPVTTFNPNFDSFEFPPRTVPEGLTVLSCLSMFEDLGFLNRWRIKIETLVRFLLMVKKGYRNPPYHNWMHAYSVTHFCYLLIKNLHLQNYLEDIELLALFVSCLCHDIDHRGTTNSFQVQSQSVLAALYSSEGSVMERHHLAQSMCILNTEGSNLFEQLSSKEYQTVLDLMKEIILATDLAHHLRKYSEQKELAESGKYDRNDPADRNTLVTLLMTACDLSDQTKNWNQTKLIASLVYQEFFSQGDLEKALGKNPLEMMDRERACIPELQISFLDNIAAPVYRILVQIFPEASIVARNVEDNRKHWVHIGELLTLRHGNPTQAMSLEQIISIEDSEGVDEEAANNNNTTESNQQVNGR